MKKRKTTEQFIQEAQHIHGTNKYNYSEVDYKNAYTKVKIYCNKCKKYFWQTPDKHINMKHSCPRCSGKYIYGQEEFIEKVLKIHNNNEYNYSKVKYINNTTKIEIICNKCHKSFFQTPYNHLHGRNCPFCAQERRNSLKSLGTKEFIKKAQKIHLNKYDYSEVKYENNMKKIKIFCNKCKEYFWQSPCVHLRGSGCPKCSPKSNGEKSIKEFLLKNKIYFKAQKFFKECKDKRMLPFDFYLPNYNICIEYQGIQHYKKGFHFFLGKYKTKEKALQNYNLQKKHDRIKKKFCKDNNIILLEIKYNDNIEDKLKEILNDYKIKI